MDKVAGWKVVRRVAGPFGVKLWSVYAQGHEQVEYLTGVSVRPRPGCGPLCVFPELRHARRFLKQDEAERALVACYYTPDAAQEVWGGEGVHTRLSALSRGTMLASSVTILAPSSGEDG